MKHYTCLPYGGSLVVQNPPGLGWVEVAAPQLPVEALRGQRVLLHLKRVELDVVKRGRHHSCAVFLDALQNRFCPGGDGERGWGRHTTS